MEKPKYAIIIGCNYSDTSTKLYNCTKNSLQMNGLLIDAYQYQTILLNDNDPGNLPTKDNILSNLTTIIDNSYNYSEIMFYYIGHGAELTNYNSDSFIVPCDYLNAGSISQNDIYNIIKNKMSYENNIRFITNKYI